MKNMCKSYKIGAGALRRWRFEGKRLKQAAHIDTRNSTKC